MEGLNSDSLPAAMEGLTSSASPQPDILSRTMGISEGEIQRLETDLDGLSRSVGKLRQGLEQLRSPLVELSETEDPGIIAKCWMKQVRELCYDTGDYLYDFLYSGNEFEILGSRALSASERFKRYQIESSKPIARRLPAPRSDLIDHGQMVDKVKDLLGADDKELMVISIVGPEGAGKTTLAKRLYRSIGQNGTPYCRAFLRASPNPDTRRLLTSMFMQILHKRPSCSLNEHDLIHNIGIYLQNKRYFIVIDDLWNVALWDRISHAFPKGDCCSRIITTTQFKGIALACCGDQSKNVCKIESLSDAQSENLFFRTVGSEIDYSEELKEVRDDIIRKCGGLPLATINIASMLPCGLNYEELKRIQHSLPDTLRTNSAGEWMKKVVNLIYSTLRPHLKTCLLYFSMYPEGYIMMKGDLVKQWVVEGFLDGFQGQATEEIAGGYFDELVERGMIQCVSTNKCEVLSCTLHHVIRDVIMKESMEENFVITVDYFQSAIAHPDKVRRLSIQFGDERITHIPESIMESKVRSLAFFGFFQCVPSIVKYAHLRVLILHIWADKDEHAFDLAGISELLRLRYLKIACNITVKLPDEIHGQQYLETLEVYATLTAIPRDIGELRKLRILKIAIKELLRQDICILQELISLTSLSVHVNRAPIECIVFDEGGFYDLKFFTFRCSAPHMLIDEYAMPKIEKLELYFNAHETRQDGKKPITIRHFASLQKISAKIWHATADADSALAGAITNDPRNPKVQLMESIEDEEHGTLEEQDEIMEESAHEYFRTQDKGSGGCEITVESRYETFRFQDDSSGGCEIMEVDSDETSRIQDGGSGKLHTDADSCVTEFLSYSVICQLISSTIVDHNNGNRGKVGAEVSLGPWITSQPSISITVAESQFTLTFDWAVDKLGVPGAIIIKNNHASEFFLKTITLDNVPGHGTIVFVANSWVYPQGKYGYNRVFFSNDTYLPSKMPAALKPYRDDELRNLRGDEKQGPYEAHDRVYRYDVYNDLGDSRQILGGSKDFPYPRRCRTGREVSRIYPDRESRPLPLVQGMYVPRDELFGHLKQLDFLDSSLKALADGIIPAIRTYVDLSPKEFDSFADILKLYEGGIKLPNIPALEEMRKRFPLQLIPDLIIPMGGDYLLKLPMPEVIKQDEKAWMTDDEFAREILAGVNPMMITRVTAFPPKSTLDPSQYGDHTSTITEAQIGKSLEGLTAQQAVASNRLYILDHHDHLMPYLVKLNNLDDTFLYATRTLLFLRGDGTLAPVAIELSTPLLQGRLTTAKSTVYTPASTGVEAWTWQLAKAYVCVNDYGWHQLVSHWLNTHAVMEPFIIATNRQLSVTHPVHKLLQPHYRDTMNINARARELLISAGGVIEQTVFQRQYALEMSSVTYKNWNFTEQALPDDLIKRGMAVRDPSSPHKVRLLLEDYPYAVDGLAIWHAIELWVTEYLSIYYTSDNVVQEDAELQAWWTEVREVGHGDLKDEAWWPKMKTVAELVKACTTIIWTGSALHAAVNFGQYPYAGYHPNKPSASRRPMPEPGTKEYALLAREPEKVFIRTITSQLQAIIGISLLEILSKHSNDEIYLGQRDMPEWTSDAKALQAFKRFGARLEGIESQVVALNGNPQLKNRNGPAKIPYMLLYPNTSDHKGDATGLTAKGIPNSISI